MFLFCHPTGATPARQAALALAEAGLLGEFWTCVQPPAVTVLRRLVPDRFAQQLLRRTYPAAVAPRLRAVPVRELVPVNGRRPEPRPRSASGAEAVAQALERRASARLAEGPFSGVYAYEHGAERSFRVARDRGLVRLYDVPVGYWRTARFILEEEAELAPEWARTLPPFAGSAERDARRDEELSLADIVFVASTFALQTLELAPEFPGTVVINPPGAPSIPVRSPGADGRRRPGARLRVLFVGSLGQRTGLAHLLEACERLGAGVELTLIGSRPGVACAPLEAALARHRWIARCGPERIREEMTRHDVFVLPSLFGLGGMLLEAMAMGMPVITTPHTAGPDLIDDGVQGFIVPIRSPAVMAEKLELLRADPELGRTMGEAARERAAGLTWQNYRQNLAACASSVLA